MSNRLTPWQAKLEVEALFNKLSFIEYDDYLEHDPDFTDEVKADEIYWAQALDCLDTAAHLLEDAAAVRNNRIFDDNGIEKDDVPLPIYFVGVPPARFSRRATQESKP